MQLTTERLLLREFETRDISTLHAQSHDPEVRRFDEGEPLTETEFHAIVREIICGQAAQPRTDFYFVMECIGDQQTIGSCYLAIRNLDARQAEVGYTLGKAHWGQGYATEAAREMLRFGFDDVNMHRIFATVIAENVPSIRVIEKIGLTYEASFRENQWFQERWWDTCIYAILEHEWRATQSPKAGT